MPPKNIVNTIAFVDTETTGMRMLHDRIIEIGILRVENNRLVQKFHTLINPQSFIPTEILLLTGIAKETLEKAPTFREVAYDIEHIMKDCIFVAHNVRFDYGFLKNEFKRLGITFSPKHFCTVKLSRALFPNASSHNLDSIIARFNIPCQNRHRALDDAKVLWEFYQIVQKQFSQEILTKALTHVFKHPSLPVNLPKNSLSILPEGPGVYIFYGAKSVPLYVGKSKNIRTRVLSHFSSDHRARFEMNISQQIESVEAMQTAGELGALLRESTLIKKLQPLYNRKLRISKRLIVLQQTQDNNGYLRVALEPLKEILPKQIDTIIGIFKSVRQAKDYLIHVKETHSLCEKLLGLEKTKHACFSYRLGTCKGACVGEENPLRYNMRFIMAFANSKIKKWPFRQQVQIEEYDTLEEKREIFTVDKWCLLSNFTAESSETFSLNMARFDVDTYKILSRYLLSAKKNGNIRVHLLPF